MNNQLQLVTFKQAKQLKELGFVLLIIIKEFLKIILLKVLIIVQGNRIVIMNIISQKKQLRLLQYLLPLNG